MGCGKYGEVRKCIHKSTKVVRAVKILKKDKLDDLEIKRMMHDIEIMKELDHPNILKFYEYYEDLKRYYVVTELCSGGELYEEIYAGVRYDEREISHILRQICGVAAYLHK